MKDTTQRLITITENEFMLNQAILCLQGFAPETTRDSNDLHDVRRKLINMRDRYAGLANEAIAAVEDSPIYVGFDPTVTAGGDGAPGTSLDHKT